MQSRVIKKKRAFCDSIACEEVGFDDSYENDDEIFNGLWIGTVSNFQ